jgi:3-hydroxyisobutyrate dehydrogenase-like beta-hydroxyacid dehydrogenase
MAKNVFVVGDRPGLAQIMKLVNNLISAANMASAFEALVVGAKAGLDPDLMVQVVNASTGRNSATQDKVPQSVLTGSFDYGARLDILYKDITLGLSEAEALGVPTWTLNAVTQLFRHGVTAGKGPEDFTSLIQLVEGWAGAEVRSRATRS